MRDFVGKTLLFKGKVETSNPSGQMAIAIDGAPACIVFGRTYDPEAVDNGQEVFIGVRPEDVELFPATAADVPAGMIGGHVCAALFIGERIEYQVDIEDQGNIVVYGDRHVPIAENTKIWLRLRPDGHSAWSSKRARRIKSVCEDPRLSERSEHRDWSWPKGASRLIRLKGKPEWERQSKLWPNLSPISHPKGSRPRSLI